MSPSRSILCLAAAILIAATGCQKKSSSPAKINASSTPSRAITTIGGEKILHLTRRQTGYTPQFLAITLFPGRGLNVFQISAYIPGRGNIDVLASPSLRNAAHALTGKGPDLYGDNSYTFGGAFLIPYPNRIFGNVSAQNHTVTTSWHGHKIVLPANVRYGIPPHQGMDAMHGLILESKVHNIKITPTPDGQTLTATLHAGNFGGHWLSSTNLHFTIALTGPAINLSVKATNVGKLPEPMAIGWHPYFAIPSGHRKQARLYVPATMRALINNYQVEKPTGKFQPVKGTPYDFNSPTGTPLDSTYLDDNFSHLIRSKGDIHVKIADPAANYGIQEIGLSPEIHTVQIYSPSNARFIAIEQQYNFVDPFGPEWHGINTGMVDLKPGRSTTWHVRLQLFTPLK